MKSKYSLADLKTKARKGKVGGNGRSPFTTMINPDVKALLQKMASSHNSTVAQVLEDVILEYFGVDKNSLKAINQAS